MRSINLTLAFIAAATLCAHRASPQNLANSKPVSAVELQRRSLFQQRASLKRQMGETSFTAYMGTTFYGNVRTLSYQAQFLCPALETDFRDTLIAGAARKQEIDPELLRAVMHHESAFRPCAVSSKGALGLMQLMPSTLAQYHVTNPFDPVQSVNAGAALLRSLLEKYGGDLKLTLAAYNAGSGRVDVSDRDNFPSETKNYIAGILSELGVNPD